MPIEGIRVEDIPNLDDETVMEICHQLELRDLSSQEWLKYEAACNEMERRRLNGEQYVNFVDRYDGETE